MSVTISRLFDDYGEAQAAVKRLEEAGVPDDDISIVANNSEKWFTPDLTGGAGKGAAIGAGFGGVGGLFAGLGLMAVPGIGPVVAAGWLAATLAGAVAVGAAGGVIGMLAEAGVAANEAEVYAESIRRGGSLVTARVPDADKARLEQMLGVSAVDIAKRRDDFSKSGWTHYDAAAPDFSDAQVKEERARHHRTSPGAS